ncbi:MAG: Fic family protein [Clostridiales Family XIII bacterium]|jgi:Fic family protein|nr:Fic family protein [Clostridiales Family XIII bacterium]
MTNRENRILASIKRSGEAKIGEIVSAAGGASLATVKRDLAKLAMDGMVAVHGRGKATRYALTAAYLLLEAINIDSYFEKEIDERDVRESFNWALIRDILPQAPLFTPAEKGRLKELQQVFANRVSELSETAYHKELERLAIDLSWKSSQIEGNTYSLLETERLLTEKQTAAGKTKEEATMLLNHKDAIDFIIGNSDFIRPLSASAIESVHSLLVKDLAVDRNIRTRRVGISGTNYRPLDNEFQIKEALEQMCVLVNGNSNVFEKALITLLLISYIQPFMDGNKRTARIVGNAVLMDGGCPPMSFRTVDSVDYKKAMLIFYEQNNAASFKHIFMEQFEFAVDTYF